MTLSRILSQLTGRQESEDSDKSTAATDPKEPAPEPGPDPAIDAIKNVRDDLTKYGTAIGVGSTLVVGGTAFATIDAMFPLPTDLGWLAVAAAIAAAIVGSVTLTSRFFVAKRRILIDTMEFASEREVVPAKLPHGAVGLSSEERELVEGRLKELAHEEAQRDASLVEARAERLERVATIAAARGETEVATYARAEAKRLARGLDSAIAQAALLVIERRSAAVYGRVLTLCWAIAAAMGIAGLYVVADWSKGEREQVTEWVACQKDFKGDDGEDLRATVCGRLDPRPATEVPSPELGNSPPAPSPKPTANTSALKWLNQCAKFAKPGPLVPVELWERALAECAGLSAPTPSPSPS